MQSTAELINESMPEIKAAVVESLKKRIVEGITWETAEAVKKEVTVGLVAELVPLVKAAVDAEREAILAEVMLGVTEVATTIGTSLRETLKKQVLENMKPSVVADLMQKLVRGY